MFELRYEAPDETAAGELRFRITLESTERGGRSYTFDQRERRSGWLLGDRGRALFRPKKPVADGEYLWRAEVWNGVEWTGSRDVARITVDTVPPAAVEGLRVRRDVERDEVHLEWNPVALDAEGRPEFVSRYHVYRYQRRGFPLGVKTLEIGVTEETRFVDRSPPEKAESVLYYRVTAEDHAGNEPGSER